MNKQTTTALYVVGGLAVLAAAGTAIYFVTKKPALGAGTPTNGGSTQTTPTEDKKKTTAPSYQASALPLELQSFANWVTQNSKLLNPDTGDVEGS